MIVVSTGCPAGIGPEVSIAAAAQLGGGSCVLVGDLAVLRSAAELCGVPPDLLVPYDSATKARLSVLQAGPSLTAKDWHAGKPTQRAGAAQLEYIRAAYELVAAEPKRRVLVTGPVSKAAIASCGARGSASFRGHTEYLEKLDHAAHSTMCFAAEGFSTSLVTTHVPLARVGRSITAERVTRAVVDLVSLLRAKGLTKPRVAVASLNPHAGESELLGKEESQKIIPGLQAAKRALGRRADITGPVGAETAYRKASTGTFDGVVAMYHDQATIPMKLIAFGEAVNVTMGLSIVRTSVDHGTGYDIAWRGQADHGGMLSAMRLAVQLRAG